MISPELRKFRNKKLAGQLEQSFSQYGIRTDSIYLLGNLFSGNRLTLIVITNYVSAAVTSPRTLTEKQAMLLASLNKQLDVLNILKLLSDVSSTEFLSLAKLKSMSYKELEHIIETKIQKAIRKHEIVVAFISSIIGLLFIMGLFHAILLNHTQIQSFCLN